MKFIILFSIYKEEILFSFLYPSFGFIHKSSLFNSFAMTALSSFFPTPALPYINILPFLLYFKNFIMFDTFSSI